jgi:hypothetical protein
MTNKEMREQSLNSSNSRSLLPEGKMKEESTLDKVRVELENQEKWLAEAGYNAYNVSIAFNSIRLVASGK